MTNLYKGLRCPWDTGVEYFDRRLCVKDSCDTMCPWRYDIDGNRPKEHEPKPVVEQVEVSIMVRVKVGELMLEVWT